MESSFDYVRDYGIEQENDYPYYGYQGACAFSQSLSVLQVWQYMTVASESEEGLQDAVGKYSA